MTAILEELLGNPCCSPCCIDVGRNHESEEIRGFLRHDAAAGKDAQARRMRTQAIMITVGILVAGTGSGLCDIFNAQGLEPMT